MKNNEKQEFVTLIDKILDMKEEVKRLEANLELYKNNLLNKMRENKIPKINTMCGKAQIIAFDRDTLKKYETLSSIQAVNEGEINEICIDDLLNTSKVCFVLVKPS